MNEKVGSLTFSPGRAPNFSRAVLSHRTRKATISDVDCSYSSLIVFSGVPGNLVSVSLEGKLIKDSPIFPSSGDGSSQAGLNLANDPPRLQPRSLAEHCNSQYFVPLS